jgi:NADPH2:quinone reductase
MKARVARIDRTGGPEVIGWHDAELPAPAPDEVTVRHEAVGLNFIDIYHRNGVYPVALPGELGFEAAGVVEAVGADVTGLQPGDRVGSFTGVRGAYATARNLAAADVVRLPDGVDPQTAAALMLKGCTTEFLVERCARVEAGQTVLVHAAAGGVGHLLVGWLKAIGATVIGTVGTEAKADLARAAGADHVLLSRGEDVAMRVRALTDGLGVPVIFDGVGKATWPVSLAAAARRGLIVSYGNASGTIEGVNLGVLAARGSLFVTRPTLFDYCVTHADKQASVDRVFAMLAAGAIRPEIGQTYALEDVADAHRALEGGDTHGSTVLLA